jgi:hypothetical protein
VADPWVPDFLGTTDGTRLVDKLFHGMYDIPGDVEPLVCHDRGYSGYFIFTAGSRYYGHCDEDVCEFEAEFASKDDFLERRLANYDEMMKREIAPQPERYA